jgi:Zn-dependent protease/CBS domain-containing protein
VIGRGFPLLRIFGIEVGIHWSWLIIFALVTWSLAVGFFPGRIEDLAVAEGWVLGAVASVLLFVSVLVHELAHAFMARRQGLEAKSITLFLFGGVANLGGDAKKPSAEFLIAVVGPLTSLAIAAIAGAAALSLGLETRAGLVAGYLGAVNALLAVFNLIPGFPLDGGRLLRAIVWRLTGNIQRATRVAGFVGQLFAWGLMFWGFLRLLAGDLVFGVWTVAIGWFLNSAASMSVQQVIVDQRLSGLRVRDVLRADRTAVGPGHSVAELIELVMLPGNRRAVPVVDGRLVGIVTLGDVRSVSPDKRAETPVAEIMSGATGDGPGLVTVRPDDTLLGALEALGSGDFEQVPVVDRGELLGLLTRADIVRAIQVRELVETEGEDQGSASILRS